MVDLIDMKQIRHAVMQHGATTARDMFSADARQLVDMTGRILADEVNAIGITYAGFCLTALPHKKLADTVAWERHNGRVGLLIEPGRMRRNGKTTLYGVPYGSLARIIMLYLQTQALRTGSPRVELGRSMNAWLTRMGISPGGKTYKLVDEQAKRISACHLSFFWEDDHREGFEKDSIVKSGIALRSSDEQGELWEDTVCLSDRFYQALKEHPVPVQEAALREISNQSLVIDVYVWLAYRLHSLSRPVDVSWPALYAQFGAGFATLKGFRPTMRRALQYALAVYPDAQVEEIDDGVRTLGIRLFPARPPVARRLVAAGGLPE